MHSHSHTPSHSHGRHSHHRPRLWWLLVLSGIYMVAEIVGGIASGSLALLADAGHMAIDVAAMGLSLFALWIATKPPTDEKTYGYYRAEILAALVNGASLVVISFWIIYEAIHRMGDPPEIRGWLMAVVAAGGLVINLVGLGLIYRQSKDNLNLQGVWLHLVTDTLGSVSSLIAGGLVVGFGWRLADPVISVAISLLILYGSWELLSDCVNVLLEGCPKGIKVADIKSAIEAVSAVAEVHDLHVWTMTSHVHALSAHVKLRENSDYGLTLKAISELVKEKFHIEHVTFQLEPLQFTHPHETHF
jgi:cobalt-zinc-cadmium efflux system protein